MCFVYEWDLIFPDGSRLPQHRIHSCGAGSPTSPCRDFELVREPPRHAPLGMAPRYVEGRPAAAAAPAPNRSGGLRSRRGADDIRIEFEFHIPGTSRSSDSGSHSRRSSSVSSHQARGPGFGPIAATSAIYSPVQYVTYNPEQFTNNWQQWTPPPRVITVDPARATPPSTPQRSRSAGPTAGREHTRGQPRQHSRSSSRPGHQSPPPHPETPRRSTVSLDDERAQRIREISAQIDQLVIERDQARRIRASERRINEITAQIDELRRQRRRGGRRQVLEVHQRGETTVRPPHRPHHRAGESLDERGRRVLQRDADAAARTAQLRGGNEGRSRQRRLTIGEGGSGANLFEGLFRRSSGRRPRGENIVYEGEPRHGERHR